MEPFWDLKIGIYVEYLTHVSSEYIISWALLSLLSTAGRTSHILLDDVIPWINKASLVLYIARTLCAMLRLTWCSEAVEFVSCDWKLSVSRSRVSHGQLSDSISAIEAPVSMCVRTILTTFYHMNHYSCSYWASGQVFIIIYPTKLMYFTYKCPLPYLTLGPLPYNYIPTFWWLLDNYQ